MTPKEPIQAIRRAFGPALRQRELSLDIRVAAWIDSLVADAIFGWRQLRKNKVTSAAAILSLGLGIGACTSAFRLIDALLLRPLPVAEPERLYAISFEEPGRAGKLRQWDTCSYPMFRVMRAAVKKHAELIAISHADRTDLAYGSDGEMEKAYVQYVSGWMFGSFGLRPAAGRLFTENDDSTPGAHPYAVLSYDYWTRRFARDPKALGRTFRMGDSLYQIAGIVEPPFTGTETGAMTDVFVPTMMRGRAVDSANSFWFRTFVRPKPGVAVEPLRDRLYTVYRAFEHERAKTFTNFPKDLLEGFPKSKLLLDAADSGVSGMQKDYRRALMALAVLVLLVLLIACANVANLMTAQAAARAREMALRVSIGAGRRRLVQLVLVESLMLALLAAALGGLFSSWSAPFVVSLINPPDNPARLALPADWRLLAVGLALALGVTCMFGLAPALRASRVKPAGALRGDDPHSRRRLIHAMVAIQAAFCFLVLFVAGLFVATFERLSNQPTGFSADRVLTLDTVTPKAQTIETWDQLAEHLRGTPGVETVALAGWPLLSGFMSNNYIAVPGVSQNNVLAFFMGVSPGWMEGMRISFVAGRDFRAGDIEPGVAIVNETFARRYFHGENPVGRWFQTDPGQVRRLIVGLVHDAVYRDVREPMLPVAYVPFHKMAATREATLIVRTSGANPLALAGALRREVSGAGHGFRVTNLRTQREINESHTVRERMLALLSLFFAVVALSLSGVGLYGVLDYSVLQRRREIGIRMAVGAQARHIAAGVTIDVFWMVLAGSAAGLALGTASVRFLESLFYQVKATDLKMLALPALAMIAAAFLAALAPVIRALGIDPAAMLRNE